MNQFDPGSDQAIVEGCTCPRMDNNYGAGVNENGEQFVMDARCPLHSHDDSSDDTLATADGDPDGPVEYDIEEL